MNLRLRILPLGNQFAIELIFPIFLLLASSRTYVNLFSVSSVILFWDRRWQFRDYKLYSRLDRLIFRIPGLNSDRKISHPRSKIHLNEIFREF